MIPVISLLPVKNARPFELDEQLIFFEYINTHDNLTNIRSGMDSFTFRNLVNLAFATGQRIGELLALQIGILKKGLLRLTILILIVMRLIMTLMK